MRKLFDTNVTRPAKQIDLKQRKRDTLDVKKKKLGIFIHKDDIFITTFRTYMNNIHKYKIFLTILTYLNNFLILSKIDLTLCKCPNTREWECIGILQSRAITNRILNRRSCRRRYSDRMAIKRLNEQRMISDVKFPIYEWDMEQRFRHITKRNNRLITDRVNLSSNESTKIKGITVLTV